MSDDAKVLALEAKVLALEQRVIDMTNAVSVKSAAAAEKESSCTEMWRYGTYWWGTALMLLALSVTLYGIGMQWNNPPWPQAGSHPALEIFLFLFLLTWIALLEGCQISIVGLQDVNMEPYKESHPRAYAVCQLAHKGPNVERFLVGRQFLLLFNGFLASRIGGAKQEEFYMGEWEWNIAATQFFWSNSVLLMILIVGPFQLVTQLIAADKMMEFLNLRFYGYYTVLLPCLFMESIGLTHSSYLLKDVLAWAAGIDTSTEDPGKRMTKDFLYYFRCLLSVSVVIFSGIFLVKGWAMSQTGATTGPGWERLPGGAAVVVSILFLSIMSMAEGLQVSALVLMKQPTSEFKEQSPLAYKTCQLLFKGRNMQAFLVGRQFLVAMMMVLLARVTGYAGSGGVLITGDDTMVNVTDGSGNTSEQAPAGEDWGMGKGFNEWLLQTGWLGAVFVTNVAQLASQVTASIFPVAFINNRILNVLLRVMLFVEFSGIVNSCWPLAWGLDSLLGLEEPDYSTGKGKEDPKSLGAHTMDRMESMQLPLHENVQGRAAGPLDIYQDVVQESESPLNESKVSLV